MGYDMNWVDGKTPEEQTTHDEARAAWNEAIRVRDVAFEVGHVPRS